MPYRGEPELECHTAKHQLKQARKWLDELMKSEIFNDDEDFDRHIHAFCNTLVSSIDYVHADFVFHKIKEDQEGKPKTIDWKKFTRGRVEQERIIEEHSEKDKIKKFRGEFKNKKENLLKIPLINYFYNKRQESTHIRWSGATYYSFEGEGEDKRILHRALEGNFWLLMYYDNKINSFPQFDKYITIEGQVEAMRMLTSNDLDIREIGNLACNEIEKFIHMFDGKNFFS